MNFIRKQAVAFLAAALWLNSAVVAEATIIATKDSADFDYKYEMDVMPNADDQGGSVGPDWNNAANSAVSGGILTQLNGYAGSNNIWDSSFSMANGWTIEASVKVISEIPNAAGATVIQAFLQEATHPAQLQIHTTGQVMGNFGAFETLGNGTEDNTDAFHVFRMAQSPGEEKLSVWRDGVLLFDDQTAVGAFGPGEDGNTWLYFGDLGGAWGGEVQYEYFRFTQGAFAPVSPAVSGDYNNNGAVDAADYVMWRKQFGQNGPGLASDGTGPGGTPDGSVDNLDYTFWRAHFGETSGVGSASGAGSITTSSVPEPATLSLLFALSWTAGFRSRSRKLAGR